MKWLLYLILVSATLLISGCAGKKLQHFDLYHDQPIPAEIRQWLRAGEQTHISGNIRQAAELSQGRNRRERLYHGMDALLRRFDYDPASNAGFWQRTAADLFAGDTLGGCADYALAATALLRALKIPTRMLIAADVNWLNAEYHPLRLTHGHIFLEVWLEEGWHLLDVPYQTLYSRYTPEMTFLPHHKISCGTGSDLWAMHINSLSDLNNYLNACGNRVDDLEFHEPALDSSPI